jgi:putative transposase
VVACLLTLRAAMTTKSTALTFRHITSKALERAKLTIAYALLERDLFRAHRPTAARRLTDDERRQLARLGHDIGWRRLLPIAAITTVRTIRRWFRELIDPKNKKQSPGGKNRTSKENEKEIVRLATENSWGNDSWGAKRIVGEMLKLGVDITKSTVSAILKRHGIPPAPDRGRVTDGDRVIVHDPATTVAIDFAKVLILDQGSICLMSILIAIHLGTREMEIVNVAHNPDGRITVQCVRNLTMDGVGFFKRLGIKTVIMDRDPVFTEEFRHLLSEAGCEPHRIAPRCPWENGYAERFIRSLKESLLRKCDFDSESALRLALFEFQTYFNNERPHQGIDNRTVLGSNDVPTATGKVVRIPRVGGLINHYERVA